MNSYNECDLWYLYISRTRNGRYYVGISNDVERRIEKHNQGKGSRMARQEGPFVLVYKSAPFDSKSEARKREV